MIKRRFGWLHELPDYRDISYKGIVTKLPKSVDLTENCSPVENQGSLGSCTANALAGILEYNEKKDSTFMMPRNNSLIWLQLATSGNRSPGGRRILQVLPSSV